MHRFPWGGMTKCPKSGRAIVAIMLMVVFVWPALVRYQMNVVLDQEVGQRLCSSPSPHGAASDIAFDRYLDQVITGQSPTGSLPAPAPPSLRGTFLAVRALQLLGFGAEIDATAVQAFITSCYSATSCLFADEATNAFEYNVRVTGYSGIEATYYALATLDLLGDFQPSSWQATADAILALQEGCGGFACRPGVCPTNDAYFAYVTLQLLGSTSNVNGDTLATFLDARQMADPDDWWEYGAFTNLPKTVGLDGDFTIPNLISSYYAVAGLAACGHQSVLNEAGLIQFTNLLRNTTSNLYSYSSGNDRAENVGTAFLLALDQYLASDGSIYYSAAGDTLLLQLESGRFNEGRKAPANLTLSAACEIVWGLSEGGRLAELTTGAKDSLQDYIASYCISTGSMRGYSLTRLGSFAELASIIPAITGAGKMDDMDVDALYSFIKSMYNPTATEFSPNGGTILQHDLPAGYNPASPDGYLARGIGITLPALQVLQVVGRLNDFLGETNDLDNLLDNISACQILDATAVYVHGAFCAHTALKTDWEDDKTIQAMITLQWTLQALQAIAILDPATPTAHFDADAVWSYLSQNYTSTPETAYFITPYWINISAVEWTCRVATALCKAGMASYFDPAKVNAWVIDHLDGTSAREVSWHLRFITSTTGLTRANYTVTTLDTLKDSLVNPSEAWYHAQEGTWPDSRIVGILAQFRADRQIYLTNLAVPNPIVLGGTNTIAVDVGNLFTLGFPSGAILTFVALDKSTTLTDAGNGHYSASYQCTFDFTKLGFNVFIFIATKGGWQTATIVGGTNFGGTLVAGVQCAGSPVANGTTVTIKGSTLAFNVSLTVKAGASQSPATDLVARAYIFTGDTQVANISLKEGVQGSYGGFYMVTTGGSYRVAIVVQGEVLAQFMVVLDGTTTTPSGLGGLGDLPAGILLSSAVGGVAILGAGIVTRKKSSRKAPPLRSP